MEIERIALHITVEYDSEDSLDDTVDALVTACENTTPAKGTRIVKVEEG